MEYSWRKLSAAVGIGLAILVLWVQEQVLIVAGGSLVMVMVATSWYVYSGLKTWEATSLQVAILAYILMAFNVLGGINMRLNVAPFYAAIPAFLLFVLAVNTTLPRMAAALPGVRGQTDRVARLLSTSSLIGYISLSTMSAIVAVMMPDNYTMPFVVALLTLSAYLLVTGQLIARLRDQAPASKRTLIPVLRPTILTWLILIVGTFLEIFRGSWALWLATIAAFASFFFWLAKTCSLETGPGSMVTSR